MYNGFDLPKYILDEHLTFIREEIQRIDNRINELQSMKSYHLLSDDAQTLLAGLRRTKWELDSTLRHEYDAENDTN